MTISPKRGLLAATAALVLAGTGIAVSVSGAAHAQSGSRLCGMFWHATDTGENVVKLYEVAKHGQEEIRACNQAERTDGGPGDHNAFEDRIQGQAWEKRNIHMVVCEDFTTSKGWLGGTPLALVGNNWPMPHDTADICRNMNRSDSLFEMERYNLYDDRTHQTYEFQRN